MTLDILKGSAGLRVVKVLSNGKRRFDIVDTMEHVSQIGLRVETIHLGRLDDRHGACQRFRSRVGSRKEPVASSNAYWTQGPPAQRHCCRSQRDRLRGTGRAMPERVNSISVPQSKIGYVQTCAKPLVCPCSKMRTWHGSFFQPPARRSPLRLRHAEQRKSSISYVMRFSIGD